MAIDRFGQIYVTDAESTRLRVVRIDSISGSRTLVSGMDRGTGPNLLAPFALAFDSEGSFNFRMIVRSPVRMSMWKLASRPVRRTTSPDTAFSGICG